MAEVWRKEEPLSTADFAGASRTRLDAEMPATRSSVDPADGGPRLVRHESPQGLRGETIEGRVPIDEEDLISRTTEYPADAPRGLPETAAGAPLLSDVEMTDLRTRWTDIQAGFVDEPRRSVEQADQLVASAIQRLAEGFANERASLETQWDSGNNVSTEDLRLALQRYRSFFGKLLNAA
jgi:hypothetical protein